MSNRKQSLLAGGLISTAGIFISKLLGLLYVVAYYPMLQTSSNISYYLQSYNIYSYLLNIATAGLPFAIATLVARYASRKDYRTCLLVKKISFYTMFTFGILCMLGLILISTPLAKHYVLEDGGNYEIMRNALILLSLALFVVPILSSLRGFYQGFKEMELYSVSQVIEQLARVLFLLIASAVAVYIFQKDGVYSLYFGVIAASLAAGITILYIQKRAKKKLLAIESRAKAQEVSHVPTSKSIFIELLFVAIPFLVIAIFGYSDTMINQWFLGSGLKDFGYHATQIKIYKTSILGEATKIIAIPMILAPGFSSSIIPHITSAIEAKNTELIKKSIVECIESVLYIALPVCLALFVFARPILFTLFGMSLGADITIPAAELMKMRVYVLEWFALEAFCSSFFPITSTLVMAIGERKRIVFNTAIFALVKLVTCYFMISTFGMPGIVLSSLLAFLLFGIMNFFVVHQKYQVNWTYTLRKLLFIIVGLLAFLLVGQLFSLLGMLDYSGSRLISLLYLAIMGIVCMGVYFAVTAFFHIPQAIFHFNLHAMIHRFLRKRR